MREEVNKDAKEEGDDEKQEKPPQKPRSNNQQNRNKGPRPAANNFQPRSQNNRNQNSNNNQEASEPGDSPPRPKNNHNNQQRPRPHHNNTSPKSHSTQQDGQNSSSSSPQKKPMNPQGLREKRSAAHSGNGESNGQQQTPQNRGPRKPLHSSKTSPNSKEMSDLKNITVQVTTDSNAGNEIRSVKCEKKLIFFAA